VWVARVFFVWTSVYNVFVVSVFWSFMADLWTPGQGLRLFGFLAAGGSLGAMLGPVIVLTLSGLGAANLVLVAAGLLAGAALAARRLAAGALAAAGDSAGAPVGGSALGGFVNAVRSPYLGGIVVMTFLFTVTSTFLYVLQQHFISGWGTAELRTRFFAGQDLTVNVVATLIQAGLTGRLVARLGVGGALAFTPALTALGFVVVALAPGLWPVAIFFAARRILHFAVDRPAKEMLFTAVAREDRYKAKSLIDTVVYRGGDQVGSLVYPILGALAAPVGVPLALGWLAVNLALARGFAARTRGAHGAPS
jgi:AAA family ATP:ADP antiporter